MFNINLLIEIQQISVFYVKTLLVPGVCKKI